MAGTSSSATCNASSNQHRSLRWLVRRSILTIRIPDEDIVVHDSPLPTPNSGEHGATLVLQTHHVVLISIAGVLFVLAIITIWLWNQSRRKIRRARGNKRFTIDGSTTRSQSPRQSLPSVPMITSHLQPPQQPPSLSGSSSSPSAPESLSLHPMEVYSPLLSRRLECEFPSATASAVSVYEHLTDSENEVQHTLHQNPNHRTYPLIGSGNSNISITPHDSPYLHPQPFIPTNSPATHLPSPSLSLNGSPLAFETLKLYTSHNDTTITPFSLDKQTPSSSQCNLTEEEEEGEKTQTPHSTPPFNRLLVLDRRTDSIHSRSLPPTPHGSNSRLPSISISKNQVK